jgi:hypothetical protein
VRRREERLLEQAAGVRDDQNKKLAELRRAVERRDDEAHHLRRREQRMQEQAARAREAQQREIAELRRVVSHRSAQAKRLFALVRRREERLLDEAAQAREELNALQQSVARRSEQARRLYALIRRREERLVAGTNGSAAGADDVLPGHVLYVQLAGRYELIESDGPLPEPGTIVELAEGERALVGWVGKSPLPGDRRPCVFAQQYLETTPN